ncbi:MAG: hypothetical protein Kow0047_01780 [Anaerolineae bacterium]
MLEDAWAFGRMRKVCPACRFVFFEDPKVAVGAVVQRENQVLLVRRAIIPRIGEWSLPAGYMDADEEPRAACRREIEEETGIQAEIGDVLDVFPMVSPHGQGIIVIFWATAESDVLRPADDVSEAGWFCADALPGPLAFESTRLALERWRARLRQR